MNTKSGLEGSREPIRPVLDQAGPGDLPYLGEAITDVALTFLLRRLAPTCPPEPRLSGVLFRLMATATVAFAELFYFAPSLIRGGAGYLKALSAYQLHSLALLSLNIDRAAGNLFNVFYGIFNVFYGIVSSTGLRFVIASLVWLLAPADASLFLVPQVLAVPILAVWLLVRGVDAVKCHALEGPQRKGRRS